MATPSPLGRYATVQKRYDARIVPILESSAKLIQKQLERLSYTPGIGSSVRQAQLKLVLGEIRKIQHDLWTRGISQTVVAGQHAAAEAAVRATEDLERVMYTALPESVAEALSGGLRATARAGIDAAYTRVPRELSQRVYKDFSLSSGRVEATVQAGIATGLSAKELAREVYEFISPTVPGGASYAAQRLARTEINNAFHQQQIAGGQRPGVKAVRWNLSGSHKRPDECNQFATAANDLGVGCYAPADVPGKPHPQCLCYMTYVLSTPDEFRKDLASGKFDDELDARIKRNLERAGIRPTSAPVKATAKVTPIKKAAPVKAVKPRPKPKELDFDIPPPLSTSVDARIKHASDLLQGGATQNQAIKEIAQAYQLSTVDALKLVVKAQQGQLSAQVVTNSAPVGELLSRVSIPGKNGDLIKDVLKQQADLVPNVADRFKGVRLGSDADFSDDGVLGSYSPHTERVVLHRNSFTDKYAKTFRKEVDSGFCTPCGHNHTAPQSVFSHEFGHHVHKFIDEAPHHEQESFWSNVGRELGLSQRLQSVTFNNVTRWLGGSSNKAIVQRMVSKYGSVNSNELLAEIWQEYSTMGSRARPHIQRIGKMMQEMAERNTPR